MLLADTCDRANLRCGPVGGWGWSCFRPWCPTGEAADIIFRKQLKGLMLPSDKHDRENPGRGAEGAGAILRSLCEPLVLR